MDYYGGCRGCVYFNTSNEYVEVRCKRGYEFELACIGGNCESYSSKDVAKPDANVFDRQTNAKLEAAVEEEGMQLLEDLHSGKVKYDDLTMENKIEVEKAAEVALSEMEEVRSKIEDLESRPKTIEEGFNGKHKNQSTTAKSCAGCKHLTMVGCFLRKYWDCKDNGFYLHEGADYAKTPTTVSSYEKLQEEKEIQYVDDMLFDTKLQYTQNKPSFRNKGKEQQFDSGTVNEDELMEEILSLGEQQENDIIDAEFSIIEEEK